MDVDLDGINEDVTILSIAYDEQGRIVEWTTEEDGDHQPQTQLFRVTHTLDSTALMVG